MNIIIRIIILLISVSNYYSLDYSSRPPYYVLPFPLLLILPLCICIGPCLPHNNLYGEGQRPGFQRPTYCPCRGFVYKCVRLPRVRPTGVHWLQTEALKLQL